MSESIPAHFVTTLSRFKALLASRKLYSTEVEVPVMSWISQERRLRLWATDVGAEQRFQASLEFRVRDREPDFRDRVNFFLLGLRNSIGNVEKVLAEYTEKKNNQFRPEELDLRNFSSKKAKKRARARAKKAHEAKCLAHAEQVDLFWDAIRVDVKHRHMTHLQLVHDWIETYLNNLFQMAEMIHFPEVAYEPLAVRDSSPFKPEDLIRIKHLFPKAKEDVARILSASTSMRRDILHSRSQYYKPELHSGPDGSLQLPKACYALPDRIPQYDARLLDALPPLPTGSANGIPFQCPYCHFTVAVRDRSHWAKHIFDDILPYRCLCSVCLEAAEIVGDRFIWHRNLKLCLWTEGDSCALCNERQWSREQFERHMAVHLEEVALLALPSLNTEKLDAGGVSMLSTGLQQLLDNDKDQAPISHPTPDPPLEIPYDDSDTTPPPSTQNSLSTNATDRTSSPTATRGNNPATVSLRRSGSIRSHRSDKSGASGFSQLAAVGEKEEPLFDYEEDSPGKDNGKK